MSEDQSLPGSMNNSDLQEAVTMANAMVRNTSQDSIVYPALRSHLETLLLIQQERARHVVNRVLPAYP